MLRLAEAVAQVGQFGSELGTTAPVGLAFAPLPFDVIREQRQFGLGLVHWNCDAAQAQFGLDVPNCGPLELLGELGAGEVTQRYDPRVGQVFVTEVRVLPSFEQVAMRVLDRPFDDVRLGQLLFGQVAHDRSPR
jgi:hypothetical protein